MTMNLDEFKTTLAGCSSELLAAYIGACQEELDTRKLKETEKIRETLQHLDKAQLKTLFLDLGFDLGGESAAASFSVAVAEKKTRTKRSMIPHGYKHYGTDNTSYYVAPFFHPELKKIAKTAKASWLDNLSSEERLEQFGTLSLLNAGKITLADLLDADQDAVQIMIGETMRLVTREMLAAG
jgi:hypothetical protein